MAEDITQEPLEMGSGYTFSEEAIEGEAPSTDGGFTMDLGNLPDVVAPTVEDVKEPVSKTVNEEVVAATPEEEEYEAVELDEELAYQYLANSKGMTVEEFKDSLTPKQQKKYTPEIEKYQEFVEKTGNHSYKDFEATQRDWTQEPSEVVLKELIKAENPLLSKSEIDFLYDKKYSFDEDIDDDDFIMERRINTKVDLQKAHNYLDKQKEEFMVNRGSDDYIPEEYRAAKADWDDLLQQQESLEIARQSNRNDYVAKIESVFAKDYDGVRVKLGNDTVGYEEVSFKPDNLDEIKSTQMDIANFNKKFFNEDGRLEKPKEWHEALYMAEHYKTELNKAYNRGMAKQLEIDDKLSKNIQPDNMQSRTAPRAAGYTFFVE